MTNRLVTYFKNYKANVMPKVRMWAFQAYKIDVCKFVILQYGRQLGFSFPVENYMKFTFNPNILNNKYLVFNDIYA